MNDPSVNLIAPHGDLGVQAAYLTRAVIELWGSGLSLDRAMALTLARFDQRLAEVAQSNRGLATQINELNDRAIPRALDMALQVVRMVRRADSDPIL